VSLDQLHGTYWLSSTECVLTHNNNVKRVTPGLGLCTLNQVDP
jgi:hypothetical protein